MAAPLKSCSVEGCNKPGRNAGLCHMHYARKRRHGDPLFNKHGQAMRWIESHAAHSGDACLLWPFTRGKHGYGTMRHPDRPGTAIASRFMCIAAHGEPPTPEHYACHDCFKGHEGCVNPRHLRWDTNAGNQMDRVVNGNSNRGSRHGMSILTELQVLEIRRLATTISRAEIAERFEVSASAIHLIMQKRNWGWLE